MEARENGNEKAIFAVDFQFGGGAQKEESMLVRR